MMFALRASDVAFGNDVYFVNDVTPEGVMGKHRIIANKMSNIIMRSITSYRQRRCII